MAAKKKPNKKGSKSTPNRAKKQPVKRVETVRKVSSTPVNVEAQEAPAAKVSSNTNGRSAPAESKVTLPFTRMNYILLIIGVVIIGFGFFLMSLDGFVDATQFSISLYVAPVVVVAGFVEIIFAIMYQPKSEKEQLSVEEA